MPYTSFGTQREKQAFTSDFKKTLFLDMNNTATVRILSPQKFEVDTHYIYKATVQCLGEECPICSNNKMIRMQFPDTYKDEPKYSPRRTVVMVNVFDKTPVRTCSKCGTESYAPANQGATGCKKCGEILTGAPTPSNKVKVLSRGVTLFDQLDAISNAIMDSKGEVIGLNGYDMTFVVSGAGKTKTITPIAGPVSEGPVVDEKDLYDLEKVTIKLSVDELMDLQRGVSLKDIFSARRASEKVSAVNEQILPKEVLDSVDQDIKALFNQQ